MTIGSVMLSFELSVATEILLVCVSELSSRGDELEHEAVKELEPGPEARDRNPFVDAVCTPPVAFADRDGIQSVCGNSLGTKEAGIRRAEREDGNHRRGRPRLGRHL